MGYFNGPTKEEYFRPVQFLTIGLDMNGKVPAVLEDKVQAIVKSPENILGMMNYMLQKWYPSKYDLMSPVRLNNIGFGNDREYKTINAYSKDFECFIVDMSLMDRARIKETKVKEKDDMYVLELIKDVKQYRRGKAIIVIDPRVETFLKKNAELCSGLGELGVQYWDKGKYHEFQVMEWD